MIDYYPQSRLKKIEERKNKQQGLMFVLLTLGFILILVFIGMPLFVKAAIFLGDLRSSSVDINQNDKTPPAPPRILPTYEATQSAEININGYSEPGTTVNLYQANEFLADTLTDTDGNFTFKQIELEEGENTFKFKAVDPIGNESDFSNVINIIFDDEAPFLTLTTPADGSQFFDDDREIIVSGETEIGVNVKVNNYVVVVDTEGNFVKKLLLLEGENEIEIIAIDKAGNRTKKLIKVKYSR